MAPTEKVFSKPVATPPTKLVASKPKTDNTEISTALSSGKGTPLDNFKNDLKTGTLKLDECPRIAGIKVPLCEDKYILHPQQGQTFADVKKRYGILDGYFRTHGQATQLPGNADSQEILFDMPINKTDLESFVGVKK